MKNYTSYGVGGTAAIVLAFAYAHFNKPESEADRQWTNDAYVQADYTNVSSRVSGVISDVLVEDDQWVKEGDVLAILDQRDYKVEADQAEALVGVAEAAVNSTQAQILRQSALIAQARATVDADRAALALASSVAVRQRQLAKNGSSTIQALEQAESSLSAATAVEASHVAAFDAATSQLPILHSDLKGAEAALSKANAARDEAELKLSYTTIKAPISGMIGQKALRKGAFVAMGTTLVSVVPLDEIYIRANYRETQLANVKSGQRVTIEVDAVPGVKLNGAVKSIGAASGLSFAPIAPLNATGNFTKIVQRLPVRIKLEPGQPFLERLRVGMSVAPEIITD